MMRLHKDKDIKVKIGGSEKKIYFLFCGTGREDSRAVPQDTIYVSHDDSSRMVLKKEPPNVTQPHKEFFVIRISRNDV